MMQKNILNFNCTLLIAPIENITAYFTHSFLLLIHVITSGSEAFGATAARMLDLCI